MLIFPPAKINLGLHVLGKRTDGYHELDTIMLETGLCDALEILPSDKFEFIQIGLEIPGDDSDNLCVRAYQKMVENFSIEPVKIILKKCIPMGAGLGGGSADAAYVIKGLNAFFQLSLSNETMELIASELGSDCAFFIQGGTQQAKGRGELLSPIEIGIKGCWLKLVNPGIHISTSLAYAGVSYYEGNMDLANLVSQSRSTWTSIIGNDFEKHLFKEYPLLKSIKDRFYSDGAFYASMSGSGSTMYGLFTEKPDAWENLDYFQYIGSL